MCLICTYTECVLFFDCDLACSGVYYWTRASRKEQIKVKMIVADDETSTDVILQGDDEEIDLLRRELQLMEKGMVYVKGILER